MRSPILAALALCAGCNCSGGGGGDDVDAAVANQAPAVTIDAPADQAVIAAGTAVTLAGHAVDPEDGPLAGDALTWSSDRDGALGGGSPLTVTLGAGTHVIELAAVDSGGLRAAATVTVVVQGANQAPVAVIDSPADGSTLTEGEALALAGHASDPEDGTLPGSALAWSSDLDGALGHGATLTVPSPSLGRHQILLTATDSLGAAGMAVIEVEVLPAGANHAPTAVITAPAADSQHEAGSAIAFAGGASDPEDGALTGASLTWSSSRDGPIGTGASFTRTDLSVGVHIVTLTATDSDGAAGTATVSIGVHPAGNAPPAVTITSPGDGAVFAAGAAVTFAGGAVDPEDGALTGGALTWSSSRDGVLGTGAGLTRSDLSAGSHTIRLEAIDSGGASGFAELGIVVLAPNQAPAVAITAPPDGSTFTAGDTVTFTGTATDPEDGALTGSALTWSSSVDGVLGTGTPLAVASLRAGAHTITLVAVDSGGRTGSASIGVTVEPGAANLPPVALLGGPATGNPGVTLAFDGSGSHDPDGTIVSYAFDFGDGSAPVAGAAATAAHAYAAAGTYTVTLTVTDDQGAHGSATHVVEVVAAPQVPVVVHDAAERFGSLCDLAVDAADAPHIAYRAVDHPGLWYATRAGAGWTAELVEGMGFDTGGQVLPRLAIAAGADAVPRIAYLVQVGTVTELHYAARAGGGWTIEVVRSGGLTDAPLAIALDPANGDRPTILYTLSNSYYASPAAAYPDGVGAWAESAGSSGSYGRTAAGGLAFTSAGVATTTVNDANVSDLLAIDWSAAGWAAGTSTVWSYRSDWAPLVLDPSDRPVVMHADGIAHYDGAAWATWEIEAGTAESYDLAVTPGAADIVVGLRHGAVLEIARAATGGAYWQRLYQGPMDATGIGVAADSAGRAHACLFRDGTLLYY